MELKRQFKREFKEALKKIKAYDRIVVFRHQRPGFDAFGTQLGLAYWIRESFPGKTVRFVGEDHSTFTGRLYPKMEKVDESFYDEPFLAIVVDTGNSSRIDDEHYKKAEYLIKFDHHPNKEPYGNLNIVANELSSASELVATFCLENEKKYPLSLLSAKYFYSGIVGDSGRFLFPSVDGDTLRVASKLLDVGLKPSYGVFDLMYETDLNSLNFQKFVLNHMQVTPKGIAYYVLSDRDLKELKIHSENGKMHLSLMSNIKGVPIWFCVTELADKKEFRVSIRSKKIDISQVAEKYRGGGHINASGATLTSLDELDDLVKDLEALIE